MANSAEICKARLDREFVDKLKRLRPDIVAKEKTWEARLYEKEKEDKIFS